MNTQAGRDLEREGAEQPDPPTDAELFAETDIQEVTTDDEQRQYLVWDSESDMWRVLTLDQLAKDMELAAYYGHGEITHILVLFPPEGIDPADGWAPLLVKPHRVSYDSSDEDYIFTSYELRDEQGKCHGRYTTKIDGRV